MIGPRRARRPDRRRASKVARSRMVQIRPTGCGGPCDDGRTGWPGPPWWTSGDGTRGAWPACGRWVGMFASPCGLPGNSGLSSNSVLSGKMANVATFADDARSGDKKGKKVSWRRRRPTNRGPSGRTSHARRRQAPAGDACQARAPWAMPPTGPGNQGKSSVSGPIPLSGLLRTVLPSADARGGPGPGLSLPRLRCPDGRSCVIHSCGQRCGPTRWGVPIGRGGTLVGRVRRGAAQ